MQQFGELEEPHIDLTPLIDTVFLLLIFFIMAMTFSKPVLEVALAQADNASSRELPPDRLIVTIDQAGEIYFDEDLVELAAVPARLEVYPDETYIIFNIDQDAPFGSFVHVLDVAKSQQRKNFVINSGHPVKAQAERGAYESALP